MINLCAYNIELLVLNYGYRARVEMDVNGGNRRIANALLENVPSYGTNESDNRRRKVSRARSAGRRRAAGEKVD